MHPSNSKISVVNEAIEAGIVTYDAQNSFYNCTVCRTQMTSDYNAKQHLQGNAHLKKFRQSDAHHRPMTEISVVNEAIEAGIVTYDAQNSFYTCTVCGTQMTSDYNAKQHLHGNAHLKKCRQSDAQSSSQVPYFSDDYQSCASSQRLGGISPTAVAQVPYLEHRVATETERAVASGITRPKGNQQNTLSSPQTNTPVGRAINSTSSRRNIAPPLQANFEYDGRNMGRSRTDQVQYREVTGNEVPVNVQRDEVQRNQPQASAMALNPVLSNEAGFSDSPLERGLTTSMIIPNGNQQYTCLVCKTTLSGEDNVPLHLNGTRHKKEIEKQRRTGSTMRLGDESMRGMSDDTYGAVGGLEDTRDSQARSSSDVSRLSALFHNLNLSPPHRNMSMRQPSTNSAAAYENIPADFRCNWQRDARNLGRLPSNELLPPATFTKPTHSSSEESSH